MVAKLNHQSKAPKRSMRALVKYAPGVGNVELRDVPVPVIADDDVLVAVKHVGVCGSDLHIYHNTHPNHPPVTMGHEFSGAIAEVGRSVTEWQPSDRVVAELHTGACGECRLCKTGNQFACPHKRPIGWWTDGAYAEYVAVPARLLHRVPENVSLVEATLAEPLAVCLNAFQRAPVEPQSSVVVIGPGPIGTLAALAAKAAGAGSVIMVGRDSSAARLKLATACGVDRVLNSSRQDFVAEIRAMTRGLGADMVIEAAGSEEAVQGAIAVARKLGTIVALGVHAGSYRFPWNHAIFKSLNMVFSVSANYLAFEQALGLLGSRRIPTDKLHSGRLPLEEWSEAFSRLEKRTALKLVLDL